MYSNFVDLISTTLMIDLEILKTCGLNTNEQRVLLYLVEKGPSPGGLIAKRIDAKRTTIYSAISSLESRGLVIREQGKRGASYQAIDTKLIPQVLVNKAQANFDNISRASKLLEEYFSQIEQTKIKENFGTYKILSTESKEAVYSLLLDILTTSHFSAIFDIDAICVDPEAKNLIKKFLTSSSKTKYKIRDIAVKGKQLKWYLKNIDNDNHQVKVVPKKYSIPTDFILSEGTVFLTNYTPGQEMVIQIKHPDYYRSMMTVFELLWDFLPS